MQEKIKLNSNLIMIYEQPFYMNMVGMYYVWNKELYLTFIHTFAVLILGTFIAHTIVVKDRLFSKSPEESTNQNYSSCFYLRIFEWGIWMFGPNLSYLVFEAPLLFEGHLRPCRNHFKKQKNDCFINFPAVL